MTEHHDIAATVREPTGGRGPDAVIDAVGMEAYGSPGGRLAQQMAALLLKPGHRRWRARRRGLARSRWVPHHNSQRNGR